MSITFVGFNANRTGDLLDPVRGQIIEGTAMTPQLYTGMIRNLFDVCLLLILCRTSAEPGESLRELSDLG